MTGFSLHRPSATTTGEIAASWALLKEKRALSDAEQRDFADWLDADEAHVDAYADALWALDAVARNAGAPAMLALRNAALSARPSGRRHAYTWARGAAAAAAAIVAVVVWREDLHEVPATMVAAPPAERGDIYRTAIGERTEIELPDGSVATLDTDSQLRVAYNTVERGVYLLRGQALFEVAHGKKLPFQVYAKGQRITAVGTTFNVRIGGDVVEVAMVEGSVKVSPSASARISASSPLPAVTLLAGEALMVDASGPAEVQLVDSTQVASWKDGVLVFNDARLGEVVAEMNRYTTHPINLRGEASNYRISGVFKSNDPVRFSQAMTEALPVELVQSPDGTLTLSARSD